MEKKGASPERYAITNDGFSQTGEAPNFRTPANIRAISVIYYILNTYENQLVRSE
jgi:hypothetical protein